MQGRRVFLVGTAGAVGSTLVPSVGWASDRPGLVVTVHDAHPLRMTLQDHIPVAPGVVRPIVQGLRHWAQWVPLFSRSDLVPGTTATHDFAGTLDLPWPVSDRTFVARVRRSGGELELDYIPDSGNMKDFLITMAVDSAPDGGSIVRSQVEADFGLRLSKGFIEWLARRKAPQMFDALEKRALAGG